MDLILNNLRLPELIATFHTEKITPDIVCDLSMYEFRCLGIENREDVMRLRTACVSFGKKPPPRNDSTVGTPSFNISKEILEGMFDVGFTVKEVSDFLSVSESTIYRRMRSYGLRKYSFTEIDDGLLVENVCEIIKQFPRSGEKMLRELLRQKGIYVPRSRLRDVLHACDKDGIHDRSLRRLHRRVYHVEGPNHVWHIDTNHKLIRWYVVISAGVDGFSRMIMFIKALNNNKADSLLQVFGEGVLQYGTPLRVRTDKGMENVKIADFMLEVRGPGSVVAGKSVHNQRVERMWRDVYDGVLCFYWDLFSFMEEKGILDIMNPLHIYALHYVYLHKINEALTAWCSAWCTHRLRTARSTPLKLWTAGMANNPVPGPTVEAGDRRVEASNNTSFAADRPMFASPDLEVSNYCREHLNLRCPQNWTSSNFGIEVYLNAIAILQATS